MIGWGRLFYGSMTLRSLAVHIVHLGRIPRWDLRVRWWLLSGGIGIAMCSLGLSLAAQNLFGISLLNLLPWHLEGLLVTVFGSFLVAVSSYGLYRYMGPSPATNSVLGSVYQRRSLAKGLRIVAIGGGTGLSVLLRGLKPYTDNLSAIVTVSDDGGSSGRLREQFGVLPPGDFRNCLVAMSDAEVLVHDLFQYRFDQGDGLKGHSFGNLFIVAMTGVTGSFDKALQESSKVLAVHGKIMPATTDNIRLSAWMRDGSVVSGESSIGDNGAAIDHITIDPNDAEAHEPAVEAIGEAQLVLIGPGSLYTSVLPNLLVGGISTAIRECDATKMYIANVVTQKGETEGYTLADHVAVLQTHTFGTIVDYVIANDRPRELGSQFLDKPVFHDYQDIKFARLATDDLMDTSHPAQHDPTKLAGLVMDVYHGRRGASEPAQQVGTGV